MVGRHLEFNNFPNYNVSDSTSYKRQLQENLAKQLDVLEAKLVQAAQYRKQGCDCSTRTFEANDTIRLFISQLDSK